MRCHFVQIYSKILNILKQLSLFYGNTHKEACVQCWLISNTSSLINVLKNSLEERCNWSIHVFQFLILTICRQSLYLILIKHIYDTYVVQASSEIWISIPRTFDKVSAFSIPSEYLLHHTEVVCTFLKFNSNNYNS